MHRTLRLVVAVVLGLQITGCDRSTSTDSEGSGGNGVDYTDIVMPLVDGASAEKVRSELDRLGKAARYFVGQLTIGISTHPLFDTIVIMVNRETGNVIPGRVMFTFPQLGESTMDAVATALGDADSSFQPAKKIVEDKLEGRIRYDLGRIATLYGDSLNICSTSQGPTCVSAVRAALTARYPKLKK